MTDETNKQTPPPQAHVRGLDEATKQKLREALRFSASRSVMSAEDERRILSTLDAPAPAQHVAGRHPIETLWREVGLPEYFLGNDGSNHKLYALYDAIRAGSMSTDTAEAYCTSGDDLTDCFRHHITTTIGWLAFGARPGPEMQMYENGFKAGYRRCQSDNEPELGEEDDDVALMRKTLEWIEDYALAFADLEEVAKRAGMALRATTPPPPREEVQ